MLLIRNFKKCIVETKNLAKLQTVICIVEAKLATLQTVKCIVRKLNLNTNQPSDKRQIKVLVNLLVFVSQNLDQSFRLRVQLREIFQKSRAVALLAWLL